MTDNNLRLWKVIVDCEGKEVDATSVEFIHDDMSNHPRVDFQESSGSLQVWILATSARCAITGAYRIAQTLYGEPVK